MRIASLISAGTEMLYALELGEQVVAVSHECDWPIECQRLPRVTRSNIDGSAASGAIDTHVRQLLADGKPLYEVDAARLAELEPDLIVTQAQCDVCAVRYADVLAAVKAEPGLYGAKVISLNPESLGDVFADLLRIGDEANIQAQAKKIIANLQQRVEKVRSAAAEIPAAQRPRVATIEWTDPLMLAGNWVPELLELAGGRCDLTPPGQHSGMHTWEELSQFDPQVIVVCPCGFDEARAAEEIKVLQQQPCWKSLSAVKSGRVHAIDGNAYFNRPGPRLVESLELLARFVKG
jgi:iron complex transport system substrate-binding protein